MHESVTNENRRLVDCIEELNTKIRNLQGEVCCSWVIKAELNPKAATLD